MVIHVDSLFLLALCCLSGIAVMVTLVVVVLVGNIR